MIKQHCRADIQMEGIPIVESQSAGELESSIKGVQAMTRTHTLAIEGRIGGEIQEDHPVVPFLVMQAAAHWNRFHLGKDGMTAYRRLKGRNCKKEVVETGESVWYLKPKSRGKRKLESRWTTGIWAGIRDETNEVMIGTDEGIIKVRTIRRKGSEEERWVEPSTAKCDDRIAMGT